MECPACHGTGLLDKREQPPIPCPTCAEISSKMVIKEVVDWVELHSQNAHAGESLYIPNFEWEAFKKEKGL